VDDLGAGGEGGDLARHAVVETRAQRDEQVALWIAVTAVYMPCIPGMPRCCSCESGNAPRAINVVTTGMPVRSAKASSSCAARDFKRATTHVEDRTLGLADECDRVRDGSSSSATSGRYPGRSNSSTLAGYHQSIFDWVTSLGTSIRTGPGPTGRREVEGRRDGAWDLLGRLDEEVVLGDAHRDAGDVALLERVGADRGRRDLACDHDERRRVHVRVADWRDDVGRAGTTGDHRDTGPPGRQRVTLGHVARALLVAHEDVADRGVEERVVDGEDGAAGQAKDRVDTLLFEAPDECLRSCELHNVPLFLDKQKGLPCLGGLRSTCERDYRRRAPTTTRMSLRVVTFLSKHM
jgi:hypothetical protein